MKWPQHIAILCLLIITILDGSTVLAQEAAPVSNIVITTRDGSTYERVQVKRRDAGKVAFSHSAGFCTVGIGDLTLASQLTLGINVTSKHSSASSSIASEFIPEPKNTTNVISSRHCSVCSGYGTVRCPTCNGGKFGTSVTAQSNCSACNGRGTRSVKRLYSTSGSPERYSTYDSNGRIITVIRTGRGERQYFNSTEDCAKCNGTGKISTQKSTYCSACNGQGVTQCKTCSGTGVVRW